MLNGVRLLVNLNYVGFFVTVLDLNLVQVGHCPGCGHFVMFLSGRYWCTLDKRLEPTAVSSSNDLLLPFIFLILKVEALKWSHFYFFGDLCPRKL